MVLRRWQRSTLGLHNCSAQIYRKGRQRFGTTSMQQDFLFTEQPLSGNSSGMASLNQTIGLNDGIRLLGIFDAHYVIEPGLLAHGIDIDFVAAKLINDGERAIVVRAC